MLYVYISVFSKINRNVAELLKHGKITCTQKKKKITETFTCLEILSDEQKKNVNLFLEIYSVYLLFLNSIQNTIRDQSNRFTYPVEDLVLDYVYRSCYIDKPI